MLMNEKQDQAEQILDSPHKPSLSLHQLRAKASGWYIMTRKDFKVSQFPDDKEDGFMLSNSWKPLIRLLHERRQTFPDTSTAQAASLQS
jgi:hypothetical protein